MLAALRPPFWEALPNRGAGGGMPMPCCRGGAGICWLEGSGISKSEPEKKPDEDTAAASERTETNCHASSTVNGVPHHAIASAAFDAA